MKSFVRIRIHLDGSKECELLVRFENNGFAGAGSAWFNIADVNRFVEKLSVYPLQSGAELRGGFWHSREQILEQEHLFLAIHQIGVAGHVGIKVRASTPLHSDDRPLSKHSAEIELRTEYESLRRFAASLVDALRGTQAEAVIEAAG